MTAKQAGYRLNVTNYVSKFSHLFSEDHTAFLEQLDKYVFLNTFEEVTSEVLEKAFPLYRDIVILSNSCLGYNEIAVAVQEQNRNLQRIKAQLYRFFDRYCDAVLVNYLSGDQPTGDVRFLLKEILSFRQALKRKLTTSQLADSLYADFQSVCTETDMKLFLFFHLPKMGSPDVNTISLEWPEFVLDKSGDQYVVSEYSVDPPSCIGEQEFYSKEKAFDSLKNMARKYYVTEKKVSILLDQLIRVDLESDCEINRKSKIMKNPHMKKSKQDFTTGAAESATYGFGL